MARGVQDSEISVWCLEVPCCDLDCHTTLLLFFRLIHHVGEGKAIFIINFCFTFVGSELLVGHDAVFEEYLAG